MSNVQFTRDEDADVAVETRLHMRQGLQDRLLAQLEAQRFHPADQSPLVVTHSSQGGSNAAILLGSLIGPLIGELIGLQPVLFLYAIIRAAVGYTIARKG